jgi:ketosteroid isomerase-like protein
MHPNEELIHRFYDARARDDAAAVLSMLAPDIVWHEPVFYGGFAGDHVGSDAVFREVFERYGDYEASSLELHDVLANDEHAVALVSWWVRRAGKELAGREVGIYHVRDGRITEAWFYPDGDYREFFA